MDLGRDADPLTQLVIDEELRAAGVRRPLNPIGIGWAGPTLMYAGTPEQKERWLWPLLAGEEFWCQLFSEPGAGSDLAALTLRAERDRDHYVINGQKVWTSYARIAQWGILLARTDAMAAKQVAATGGVTGATDASWSRGFLFSPALTIGGGTAEVQRNIVAERELGLATRPLTANRRKWLAGRGLAGSEPGSGWFGAGRSQRFLRRHRPSVPGTSGKI